MRKVIFLFALLASLTATAQDEEFLPIKGDCLPPPAVDDVAMARSVATPRRLPSVQTNWDSTRIYRQLVILVSFKGDSTYFKTENPREFYHRMLNESGFNQRNGKGCLAEYFHDQSRGMLHLQFDVYGPYAVDQKAQPYSSPTSETKNYGRDAMTAATKMFLAENPEIDFSQYDWNGNGKVNQVIYVFAGYGGNVNGSIDTNGYLWPNTASFSSITTPDGKKISEYSSSAELWPTKSTNSCGFATIAHEFTHSLGLPDIYPTVKSGEFSICDEWDLMDGGNFTNYGWCPPNYTALERYVLGWLDFVDLTEPTTITGMKPVEEGGVVYRIKHSDSEWLLLENRQQRGWDFAAPGKGLVVYHVNYDKAVWAGNTVNNDPSKHRFDLIHADNQDYDDWYDYLIASGASSAYQHATKINSWILSTTPYPWATDSSAFVNDELTDVSTPAAQMFYPNLEGEMAFGKPITGITMSEDGLISFDFMGGDHTAIEAIRQQQSGSAQFFDLTGRRLSSAPSSRVYIIRGIDGKVRKVLP